MKSYRFAFRMLWKAGLLLGAALLLLPSSALAVEISEICASNKTASVLENGTAPDWLELHNETAEPQSLAGWYLSNDEDEPYLFSLADYSLEPGERIILCADQKELPFKLSASGGSLILSGETSQTVNFPSLSADQTYSLQPDGAWHVTEATPGEENAVGEPYVEPVFVAPPQFSHQAGFFDDPFELTLSGYGDVRIYYTTDGSVPDENAALYTGPISIYNRSDDPNVWSAREDVTMENYSYSVPDYLVDKCNIIRAVAIDVDGNKSSVVTNTYFVGLEYENIYVLSIVAAPDALFDENDGMYVLGKIYRDWLENPNKNHDVSDYYKPTNFGKRNPLSSKEREISADLQLFKPDGTVDFQQTLALRIQGNQTRNFPQKSFRVTARNRITGTDKIDVKLWDGIPKMKSLLLSADTNGNYGSWRGFPSADVFSHMLASEQGLVHNLAVPCIVFLEGEYWGVYNLTPVMNEKYIEAVTGVHADDMIVIKNNEYIQGEEYCIDEYADWDAFLAYLQTMDFSIEENYEYACSIIDMENYCRYLAVNLYLESYDTVGRTYNMTVWRTIESGGSGCYDGRWRWILQDLDLSCVLGHDCVENRLPEETIIQLMWKNSMFQELFIRVLTEFVNVDCSETNVQKNVDQYVEMYGQHIYDTQRRFCSPNIVTAQKMATKILSFFDTSRAEFFNRFSAAMGISEKICRVSVDFSEEEKPIFFINDRKVTYDQNSWTGQYYENQAVTLTVYDIPCYSFAGWYAGDTLLTEEKELILTVSGDITVQPRYEAMGRLLEINEKKTVVLTDEGVTIAANVPWVKAAAYADEELTLTAGESLQISAEEKWAEGAGLTLTWNPAGSRNMQLFAAASVSEDAPARWSVQGSVDGEVWETLLTFRTSEKEGTAQLSLSLPDAMNEAEQAYLRVVSEKKGGAGALILTDFVLCAEIEAHLEISEICTTNKTAYTTEDGETPDWIELYNCGGMPMSLAGWYLSDDEDEPFLFSLEDYTIHAQEYLILKADGQELPFKLSASGERLLLTGKETQTMVDIPPLSDDATYSLQWTGEWHVTEATPGEANAAGTPYVEPPFVAPPQFSHQAGFFDEPFDLTLSGYGDVRIYYTTDGSVPDENSILYAAPIRIDDRSGEPNVWSAREDIWLIDLAGMAPDFSVDKCSIIRAVAIDAEGNRSKVVTNTFFVGLEYSNISVLSIVADPDDLFDEDDGIYVLGKIYRDWLNDSGQDHAVIDYEKPTNFGKSNSLSGKEQEIAASYQLFDDSGKLILDQIFSIRIQGNYSRMRPQKSFKTIARQEVSGDNKVEIRLWDDLPKLNRFIVRADGNATAMPSVDVFAHMVISDQGLIYSRATPVIVFLEGEYWGLYNLRPVMDERYISDYTGIPKEDLIVIKNNSFVTGAEYLPQYRSWRTILRDWQMVDFSQDENYEKICTCIDVDSFIRFTAAYLYLNNHDTNDTKNVTVWRTVQEGGEGYYDGRWRWMYQDMDLTCETGYEEKVFNEILPELMLFNMLWSNENFQRQFVETLCEFMNVDCSEGRIQLLLDRFEAMYGPYIYDTQARFNGTGLKRTTQQTVNSLKSFFDKERAAFLEQFTAAVNLKTAISRLTVDFSTVPDVPYAVNGRETLYLKNSWTGYYLKDMTVTLSVSDAATYEFLGWYEGDALLTEDTVLTLTMNGDRTVTPRYSAMPRLLDLSGKKKAALNREQASLPSSDYQIKAILVADDGLDLTGGQTLTLAAEEKWAAKNGFTLVWNSNKYANQRLFITASASGDMPAKWTVSWSTNDSAWTELQELRLQTEEADQWFFSLPDELDDVNHAYLRFETKKKGGACALTIDQLILCADTLPRSLANIKEYAARCQPLEGGGFTPPDLEALMQGTNVEAADAEIAWRNRLVSLLLAAHTSTVAQALPDMSVLAYFYENPVYTVTEEITSLSRTGWVSSGKVSDGTAYLYAVQNGELTLVGTCEVSGGELQIDLNCGVYVLVEKKPEAVGTYAHVETPSLSQDFIDAALGGMYPLGSYQMIVTVIRPGAVSVHIDGLPNQELYGTLYAYRMTDDSLEPVGTAYRNSDGSYDIPCTERGSYLLLSESLEDHLDYAEMMNMRRQQGQ